MVGNWDGKREETSSHSSAAHVALFLVTEANLRKPQKCSLSICGQKSKISLTRLRSRCGRGWFHLEAWGKSVCAPLLAS